MNDSELKFPEWQTPFQELIVEFTLRRRPEKLQEAEALVQERLQKLDRGDIAKKRSPYMMPCPFSAL